MHNKFLEYADVATIRLCTVTMDTGNVADVHVQAIHLCMVNVRPRFICVQYVTSTSDKHLPMTGNVACDTFVTITCLLLNIYDTRSKKIKKLSKAASCSLSLMSLIERPHWKDWRLILTKMSHLDFGPMVPPTFTTASHSLGTQRHEYLCLWYMSTVQRLTMVYEYLRVHPIMKSVKF